MAGAGARLLQRRLSTLLRRNDQPLVAPFPQGFTWPSQRIIGFRNVHLEKESVDGASTNVENTKNCGDGVVPANTPEVLNSSAEASNVIYRALSNLKESPRHDVAMVFTCKVCETRSVKTICRESYEKGVVVARCGGCNNLHLIADRLGWFGEPGSVEELLAARGEKVRKGSVDTLNLTLEDLAGTGTGTKSS